MFAYLFFLIDPERVKEESSEVRLGGSFEEPRKDNRTRRAGVA